VNGLYPNGGCCHICLEKSHLVKDCPNKKTDDDDSKKKEKLGHKIKLKRIDNSIGGDDIDIDDDENDD
jgi:hypothetical protein